MSSMPVAPHPSHVDRLPAQEHYFSSKELYDLLINGEPINGEPGEQKSDDGNISPVAQVAAKILWDQDQNLLKAYLENFKNLQAEKLTFGNSQRCRDIFIGVLIGAVAASGIACLAIYT